MAINNKIYPQEYPPEIAVMSDLEKRVLDLEGRAAKAAIAMERDRRRAMQAIIDTRKDKDLPIVWHSRLPRFSTSGLRSLGTHGFLYGGEVDGRVSETYHRLIFDTEALSIIGAKLTTPRHSSAATSSSTSGYISGGSSSSNASNSIERLSFKKITTERLSISLSQARTEHGAWNSTGKGYFIGGVGISGGGITTVEKFSYLNSSISVLGATISGNRSNFASLESVVSGYLIGGKNNLGESFAGDIKKMSYTNEQFSLLGISLTTGQGFSTGLSNSKGGYVIGGRNNSIASIVDISKLRYNDESLSILSIALSSRRADASGIGSEFKGYVASGGSLSGGEFRSALGINSIERLTYGDNLISESIATIGASLSSGLVGMGGVSDYNPSIQSNSSSSIGNLYDAIYSKIDHNHDSTYAKIENVYYRNLLRRKVSANVAIYVDSNYSGSTSGDLGGIGNPFQSISSALDYAKGLDFNGYGLRVLISDGTYAENISLRQAEWIGMGLGMGASILLIGNTVNPENVILSSATNKSNIFIKGSLTVSVSGMKLMSPSGTDFASIAAEDGKILYSKLIFAGGNSLNLKGSGTSTLSPYGSYKIDSLVETHVRLEDNSTWLVEPYAEQNSVYAPGQAPPAVGVELASNKISEYIFDLNGRSKIDFTSVSSGRLSFSFVDLNCKKIRTRGTCEIILPDGTNLFKYSYYDLEFIPGSNADLEFSRRPRLQEKLTVYVDGNASMNNSNFVRTGKVGEENNPFLSITEALEYGKFFDHSDNYFTVVVNPGVYEESLSIEASEWCGLGSYSQKSEYANIRIVGAEPESTFIAINTYTDSYGLTVSGDIGVQLEGVQFVGFKPLVGNLDSSEGTGILLINHARAVIGNLIFGYGLGNNIVLQNRALLRVYDGYRITARTNIHIICNNSYIGESSMNTEDIRIFVEYTEISIMWLAEVMGIVDLKSSRWKFYGGCDGKSVYMKGNCHALVNRTGNYLPGKQGYYRQGITTAEPAGTFFVYA